MTSFRDLCQRVVQPVHFFISEHQKELINIRKLLNLLQNIEITHLVSVRTIWVTLDLPEPQGSIRNRDASTTPLTPPNTGASACSIDVATSTQEPFGRPVLHALENMTSFH
jgi:hypothetical protein